MDRCALFVDAGYVLTDGAMAVHGTRRRESVSWDYAGLLQLFGNLAKERTRLPLLRCYWYEATVEGRGPPTTTPSPTCPASSSGWPRCGRAAGKASRARSTGT